MQLQTHLLENHHEQISPQRARHKLAVNLAASEREVREAQRLRYRIFAEEMGAYLPSAARGIDADIFDPHCDHLIVRDTNSGEVVGTYRILPPDAMKRIGGYYSEGEFDLSRLMPLAPRMVEVGRSCVHPDYRTGATIALLWNGLAEYMRRGGYEYLMGCASVSMADGGHAATSLYNRLSSVYLGPVEWRVFPRYRLPMESFQHDLDVAVPPLIKGYLRAGAQICGEPAWDPDFNTADMLILLPMNMVSRRYARHFVGEAPL